MRLTSDHRPHHHTRKIVWSRLIAGASRKPPSQLYAPTQQARVIWLDRPVRLLVFERVMTEQRGAFEYLVRVGWSQQHLKAIYD